MPADRGVVAITGSTGFIGRHLVPLLAAEGWRPRLLIRRDPADVQWSGLTVEVVQGDLADEQALARLTSGASAVVHLAGLIKATSEAEFMRANREGTRKLAEALLTHAPQAHCLLVSSLAARHPELSHYAASKRAAEEVAQERLGDRLSIVRPPAVFGPGDRETLAFFKMVSSGFIPLIGGPKARSAVVHVEDLCKAFLRILDGEPTRAVGVITDERPQGYSWEEILGMAARVQGIEPRAKLQLPKALLRAVAGFGDLKARFGDASMLTSEKLRELLHEDWAVPPEQRLVPEGWAPAYDLQSGFESAVRFYRQSGWLSQKVT